MEKDNYLTPKHIVAALDGYIVGQEDAKKQVAIALRNRWRARYSSAAIRDEIMPTNILMIGSTGVGKTEIARRLAHLTQVPFVKVEATKFTEVGYVGRDVESMVRDLIEQGVNMVRKERQAALEDEVAESVLEKILDILVPPTPKVVSKAPDDHKPEDSQAVSTENINEPTRARFRERLKAGELDDQKITLDLQPAQQKPIGMISGGIMDESSLLQMQEMLSGLVPKKTKKRKLIISKARKLLLEEELDRRLEMDEIREEALVRTQKAGIIFIDEIDKIAVQGGKDQPSISKEGVQRDLLPIVEGSAVKTKYGIVRTDHILFIAAGAFHSSKPSDLMPELQGRFSTRIELEKLTEEDFLRILSEPRNALIKQYQALLESEGVDLIFRPAALRKIAKYAYDLNNSLENIGARRLHTVLGTLLADHMFAIPDEMPKDNTLTIGSKDVENALQKLVEDEDNSRYLL